MKQNRQQNASNEGWGTVPEWLTEAEWNFAKVSDSEILACCIWEFARESPSIHLAADMHWCQVRDIWNREKYKNDPAAKEDDDKEAARIKRRTKAANFDYDAFLEKFWTYDLALVKIYDSIRQYVRDGARSWQTLPKKVRSRFVVEVSESIVLCPLRESLIGELERIWNANREELDAARKNPRYNDSEEAALYAESLPVSLLQENAEHRPGEIAVAFTIDFTRFSDNEICAGMKRWLKANRPSGWKRPKRVFLDSKQRGHKLVEYRVALERLGLMRILHWLTPSEMCIQLPEAWAKYGRKQASFRREIREASNFFHKLFPFLPKSERPSSETRTAIVRKEFDEIIQKVDDELAMNSGT
jgi:hypothetical protein